MVVLGALGCQSPTWLTNADVLGHAGAAGLISYSFSHARKFVSGNTIKPCTTTVSPPPLDKHAPHNRVHAYTHYTFHLGSAYTNHPYSQQHTTNIPQHTAHSTAIQMAQSCSAVEQQHSMTRATLPCSAKAQPDVQLSNMESFLTSASPSLPAFAMPSQKVCCGYRPSRASGS